MDSSASALSAWLNRTCTLTEYGARGVGIEIMDNAAAARTFNVLAGEGRRVVAGFLIVQGGA